MTDQPDELPEATLDRGLINAAKKIIKTDGNDAALRAAVGLIAWLHVQYFRRPVEQVAIKVMYEDGEVATLTDDDENNRAEVSSPGADQLNRWRFTDV